MDTLQIEAVYEHGALKLSHELPLPEGQRVTVTITMPPGSAARRMYRIVRWAGDPEELEQFLENDDEGPWGNVDVR